MKRRLIYADKRNELRQSSNGVSTSTNNNCDSVSENRIKKFKDKVILGPYYVCVVCNRTSYRQMFVIFHEENYEIEDPNFMFAHVEGFDGIECICNTCHRKLRSKSNQIPCQVVNNKLNLFDLPVEFNNLNKLEKSSYFKTVAFQKDCHYAKGTISKSERSYLQCTSQC